MISNVQFALKLQFWISKMTKLKIASFEKWQNIRIGSFRKSENDQNEIWSNQFVKP